MLAGLPAGLLWWIISPLPPIEKRADGLYRAGGEGNESAIAADGWFAVIVLAVGIVVALLVYLRTRPSRLAPLVGLAVGGVLGSVVAWRFGALLGPASLTEHGQGGQGGRPVRRAAHRVGVRRAAGLADRRRDHLLRRCRPGRRPRTTRSAAAGGRGVPPTEDGPGDGPEADVAVSPPDGSAPSEHR